MQYLSSPAQAAISTLRSALSKLDDLRSQPEREIVYSALVAHVRSAMPMLLVGAPPLPDGTKDALIDLGEGRLVRLRVLDGALNMYVCETGSHDVNVRLSEAQREQLRAALGAVR